MSAESSTLGLLFEISADPSKAINATESFRDKASSALKEFENNIFSTMQNSLGITKEFAIGMAITTGAVVALGVAAFELADHAAALGAKIFEVHEKTGMASEDLSGLMVLSKQTGESFDTLSIALGRAGVNLEKAIINPGAQSSKILADVMGGAQNLANLGLKPADERVQELLKHIFELNDVGERNLALQTLLGRGWQSNMETLKLLAEQGYGPAIEQARKFGLLFDDEQAAQAKQFEIEFQNLKLTFGALATTIGRDLIPVFNLFMTGLIADMEYLSQSTQLLFRMWEGFDYASAKAIVGFRDMTTIVRDLNAATKALVESQAKVGNVEGLSVHDPEAAKRAAEALRIAEKDYTDYQREKDHQNKIYWDTIDEREKQELQKAKERDKEESDAYIEYQRKKQMANDAYWSTLDAKEKQELEDEKRRNKEEDDAYKAYQQEKDHQNKIYWQTVDAQNAKQLRDERSALNQRIQMFNQLASVASAAFSRMSGGARIWANITLQALKEIVTAMIERNLTEQKDITTIAILRAKQAGADALSAFGRHDYVAGAHFVAAAVAYGALAAAPIAALALGGSGGGSSAPGGASGVSGGNPASSPTGPVLMAPGAVHGAPSGHLRVMIVGEKGAASWLGGVLDRGVKYQGVKLTSSHSLRAPSGG